MEYNSMSVVGHPGVFWTWDQALCVVGHPGIS